MIPAITRGLVLALLGFGAIAGCTAERGPNVPPTNSSGPTRRALPPLDLGHSQDVLDYLDSLDRMGGVRAVVQWAERELQPGRQVRYTDTVGDAATTMVLADRSIWRLDDRGNVSSDALLPPLTDERFGESAVFAVLSRPHAEQPYSLRLRRVLEPKR